MLSAPCSSPRWAYWAVFALVGLAFGMFVWCLDRYPPFFFDEPWFNEPAVRMAVGKSFNCVLQTQAPHTGEVMAFHGPFYPRMQVLTFRLLGISHFAARIPSYLGAHLAVLALCLLLLRRGLYKSAVIVAAAWVGDRSTQQVVFGRPDGMAHLFAVLGCVCSAVPASRTPWDVDRGRARMPWDRRGLGWLGAAGLCFGTAAGFHPTAAVFGILAAAALFLLSPPGRWPAMALALAAGLAVPVALFLWSWAPDLRSAFEHFAWFCRYHRTRAAGMTLADKFSVWPVRSWAQYWHLGLMAAAVLVLAPASAVHGARLARRAGFDRRAAIPVLAAVCGLAGLIPYLNSILAERYYFLFITVWPVLGLASLWELGLWPRRWRVALAVTAFVLAMAWLPSLAWNALRFREAARWYGLLDKRPFVEQLRMRIPEEAPVMGSPVYFIAARQAGLDFIMLSGDHDDPGNRLPSDAWLVVDPLYRRILNTTDPSFLQNRRLHCHGTLFPGSPYTREDYFIYGPVGEGPSPGNAVAPSAVGLGNG